MNPTTKPTRKRKEIIEEMASIMGEGIHTGLRKWSEHPESHTAWVAISKIDDGSWEQICLEVAKEVLNSLKSK